MSVITGAQQARIIGYRLICQRPKYQESSAVVVAMGQNPDQRAVLGQLLPCLLTNSLMVLVKSEALGIGLEEDDSPLLMTGDEALGAMGWPMFGGSTSDAPHNALALARQFLDDISKR
eukprot:6706238-Lingulodinium_polyedra.AAC.1